MERLVHTVDLLFIEANNAKTKKPLLDSEQLNKISGERNFVFPFSHCSQLWLIQSKIFRKIEVI